MKKEKEKDIMKDPVLKDLLQELAVPELPKGFSSRVMNTVNLLPAFKNSDSIKVPAGIKIGIPVFLIACAVIISIFPGQEGYLLDNLFTNWSNSSFMNFFDKFNLTLPELKLPELNVSRSVMYYFLGGIGLVWMFFLSETISRKSKRNQ